MHRHVAVDTAPSTYVKVKTLKLEQVLCTSIKRVSLKMEMGFSKLIAPAIGLGLAMVIKAIFYSLNLLGEKEKHLKGHLELIKDLPPIETVGNNGKIKLLFEEAFSLTYKRPLSFHEIKLLLKEKSPRIAILKYLAASPYIVATEQGTFKYSRFNKLRIDEILIPLPLYRSTLGLLYTFLTGFGIWLLNSTTPNLFTLPSVTEPNAFSSYLNVIGAWIIGLISLTLGIKVLLNFFKLPMKSEMLRAIHYIEDKELVIIPKSGFHRLLRKVKFFCERSARRLGLI